MKNLTFALVIAALLSACNEKPHVCGQENHHFEPMYELGPPPKDEATIFTSCRSGYHPAYCADVIIKLRSGRHLGVVCRYCGIRK